MGVAGRRAKIISRFWPAAWQFQVREFSENFFRIIKKRELASKRRACSDAARPANVKRIKRERIFMTNEANMEKLVTDLKTLSHDAEAMLHATAGQAGEKMTELRGRLASTLESAKATYRRVEEKTIAGAKVADKTIREHPYESIGVAFGVGLLIGVLVGRR